MDVDVVGECQDKMVRQETSLVLLLAHLSLTSWAATLNQEVVLTSHGISGDREGVPSTGKRGLETGRDRGGWATGKFLSLKLYEQILLDFYLWSRSQEDCFLGVGPA